MKYRITSDFSMGMRNFKTGDVVDFDEGLAARLAHRIEKTVEVEAKNLPEPPKDKMIRNSKTKKKGATRL